MVCTSSIGLKILCHMISYTVYKHFGNVLKMIKKSLVLYNLNTTYISIYDKRDDFNFHITNFPFLSTNIPTLPAYGVFISQLIRYARACSSYGCFILRATRLSNKLFEQGYVKERLKSSLRKFYGRYGDLIKQYEVSLSQMLNDILWPDHIQWQRPTDQTLYQTRPFTEYWVISIEHLRRVWHAERGRLLLRTPGPVPLGLAYVLLVETNPFPNLSLFYRICLFCSNIDVSAAGLSQKMNLR